MPSDEELQKLAESFAMDNLQDRDDVIFNFEADIRRMVRKFDVSKIRRKDKKYLKKVKKFIMGVVLQAYLKDMMTIGIKKFNRYKDFYVNN